MRRLTRRAECGPPKVRPGSCDCATGCSQIPEGSENAPFEADPFSEPNQPSLHTSNPDDGLDTRPEPLLEPHPHAWERILPSMHSLHSRLAYPEAVLGNESLSKPPAWQQELLASVKSIGERQRSMGEAQERLERKVEEILRTIPTMNRQASHSNT